MAPTQNDITARMVHAIVEGPDGHFTVMDAKGQQITTFIIRDEDLIEGVTRDQRYAVVVAQIFRKIAAGEL